jgi:hypothetical protein
MRDTDIRSKCIAIVPDALVNAHVMHDGPASRVAAAGLDLVERLGFGIIQLPPHDLAPERVRRSLELVLDQVRDYAANGYRIVSVTLTALPQAGLWQDLLVPELNQRGIVLSASIGLDSHDGPDALAAAAQRLAVAVGDTKRIAS